MRGPITRLVLLALFVHGSSATPAATEEHFNRMMSWLAGRWDNAAQAAADIESGIDEFDRHPHYAMHYIPLTASAMEGQVFAIRSYNEGGFNGPLSRVALHRFKWVPDSAEIEHEFLFLREPSRWGDLKAQLDTLRSLTEADVRVNRQCRMYWRWVGGRFEGRTRLGKCITNSYTENKIRVEGHGILRRDSLVRHDMNYELSGEIRPRQGGATPELFRKQKP